MTLREYLDVLGRRKAIIVLTVLITVATAVGASFLIRPTYSATTTVRSATGVSLVERSIRPDDLEYVDRLQNTYAKLATSDLLVDQLVSDLRLKAKPKVRAVPVPNTEFLNLRVDAYAADTAAQAADRLAELLIEHVRRVSDEEIAAADRRLRQRLSDLSAEIVRARKEAAALRARGAGDPATAERLLELAEEIDLKRASGAALREEYESYRLARAERGNSLQVVERAETPTAASSPNRRNIALIALAVSLVGGAGLAFLFESLNTRLRGREEIERVAEMPVLATIPTAKHAKKRALLNSTSPAEEAFRRLRVNLLGRMGESRLRTLLVTSAAPGEGKSTIVANLARAFALSGLRVVAVDADLRLPTLHGIFDVPNETGLSTIVLRGEPVGAAIVQTSVPRLSVVPSGPWTEHPGLLESARMDHVLDELVRETSRGLPRFDMVILDTPALLAASDALMLASNVDGVVLVVRHGHTPREAVLAARDDLAHVDARTLGVVVNRGEALDAHWYYPVRTAAGAQESR
jgi:polysaccharide biosynthesis transport protein